MEQKKMSYAEVITNLVIGDDYDWDISISDVPAGQVVVSGWLTVKQYDTDLSYVFQKNVGTVLTSVGQVTISGIYTNVLITARAADTDLLNPLAEYVYDIQVITDAGRYKTVEKGIIRPIQDVT